MRLPRSRFTLFRMMVIVAITGVVMGWVVHARNILDDEGDFGYVSLFVECIGMLMLSVLALPIVFAIYLVRQDEAYATRLRRDEPLSEFHLVALNDSSPQADRTCSAASTLSR